MDYKMDGYLDQQVPYTLANKSHGNGPLNRLLMAAKRKYMDTELPPQESEDLFQDLSQLQETWLTEAQVPDSDEQFVPDFHSENSVAFHSPPVTIKKEPQSPGSDPSQSCSHKQSFSYPSGEQCLYASAYDQKRAAGGAKSSCPGTPMSPMQQHYSPKPATAGRPDAGYMNPAAASQPLPSNSYPINASSRYQGPSGDPMCPQFPPPPSQAFQRMPSAPAGHSGAGGGGVEGQVEAEVEVIIGSTRTPACPTCSRALSRNTWTRCMRGPLTWQGLGTGADRDTHPTHITNNIHTRTPTHTGSHQPT
ncbi:hypothetical protein F7725_014598 [Dissostichus mawsoni]|uniref:PEA3-type ETS-domain transcription factor N-terminal domain-containing protein n=1 Tax=Dissostichus mawsoni TaxID=36200 RepID=A0A7J5YWR3_DISMA|nr:hypothetical protein F7725_014598 [Dissostichus mawsoni]